MNLKRCPGCNQIIDIDALEDLDPNVIIGCGLNEDDFIFCDECPELTNSKSCCKLRDESGWTKTTAKEYGESL